MLEKVSSIEYGLRSQNTEAMERREVALGSGEMNQVLGILDDMAEGFKETALLVHGAGLTHAEAAGILSIKESTVSWRLHEIRKQLLLLQTSSAPLQEARL